MLPHSYVEDIGAKCIHFTEVCLNTYTARQAVENILHLLRYEDLHLMLGHATVPNRHIGAVALAVFRAYMRTLCAALLPNLRFPDRSKPKKETVALQFVNGKMYAEVIGNWDIRPWQKLLLNGVGVVNAAAIVNKYSKDTTSRHTRAIVGLCAFFTGLLVASCPSDCWIREWATGKKKISCLSEAKRKLGDKWRLLLSNQESAKRLATADGNILVIYLRVLCYQ